MLGPEAWLPAGHGPNHQVVAPCMRKWELMTAGRRTIFAGVLGIHGSIARRLAVVLRRSMQA